jgi:hypothetical protein
LQIFQLLFNVAHRHFSRRSDLSHFHGYTAHKIPERISRRCDVIKNRLSLAGANFNCKAAASSSLLVSFSSLPHWAVWAI